MAMNAEPFGHPSSTGHLTSFSMPLVKRHGMPQHFISQYAMGGPSNLTLDARQELDKVKGSECCSRDVSCVQHL